jgi:GNAT superfamily N-acetyltransferase
VAPEASSPSSRHLSIRRMRATERVEVEAVRSLFSIPDPAGVLGQAGDAVSVRIDGVPGTELNRILGLYDLSVLDELARVYEGRRYWVSLDPEAGLDDELMARGFVRDGAWQKFKRGVEPVDARTNLEIAEARASRDVDSILRTTWGVPPDAARWLSALADHGDWHCFVAYDGELPVAGAMLYATDEAGWLGVASTVVEYRCRGAQSALLAARIERARELGLDLLVTETGVPAEDGPGASYRNIVRAGFEPAYVRPNYTPG